MDETLSMERVNSEPSQEMAYVSTVCPSEAWAAPG